MKPTPRDLLVALLAALAAGGASLLGEPTPAPCPECPVCAPVVDPEAPVAPEVTEPPSVTPDAPVALPEG